MTDDLTRSGSAQLAQASGEAQVAGEIAAGQDVVEVARPPDGGEIILPSLPGRRYDLQFDPRLAEVQVIDADGDGDLDLVLLFDAGTDEQSRIVFVDMVEAAQSGSAPVLQSGATYFGADLVVQQAQALAGEQPTLETAAAETPELVGTGVTQYNDNLGSIIDLLNPQGVIPPVEATFPSIDLEETEDDVADGGSASGSLVVGSNADDVEGQEEPHTIPDPSGDDSGPILGGVGGDILIGDPGGAIEGDLNVAISLDISGSMVDEPNNPAPGVSRLDVVQDALEKILPQLAERDATVNLFIQTFATDTDDPLFVGELTADNVDDIIVDILALDEQAGGFTNYEAALVGLQDWYLDQVSATDGFTNVAFFLTDGFPNRSLDDNGQVQGSGRFLQAEALQEALDAIPDLLDQDGGILSGDDKVLLNVIGTSNAQALTLDQFDTTSGAQLVNLGDPSTLPDAFVISGVDVGADALVGSDGNDIIFGDVADTDALAAAEGIDLPPASGFDVFEALEAGQSPSSPGWDRGDTLAYLRDPTNWPDLAGDGRGEGDTIDGGTGDDAIFGQGGNDSLTGGDGADSFVYTLAADEGDDEILDFSTAEGDVLSFVNVSDTDSSGIIDIDDVLDSFVDGGGPGQVDTLVLTSGTTIMLTDLTGLLTDVASVEDNSVINGAMA